MVVPHVVGEEALLLQVWHSVRHEVVEGVVASLQRLLVGQPTLLQQVDHHVSTYAPNSIGTKWFIETSRLFGSATLYMVRR